MIDFEVDENHVRNLLQAALSGEEVEVTEVTDENGVLVSSKTRRKTSPKTAAASLMFADVVTNGRVGVFEAAKRVASRGSGDHLKRPKKLSVAPDIIEPSNEGR